MAKQKEIKFQDRQNGMEFCQKIATGEIKLEDLQAAYDAEDDAKERAVFRETMDKAKQFQKHLDAKGLSSVRARSAYRSKNCCHPPYL